MIYYQIHILWYKHNIMIYQGDHINMKELSPSRLFKKKILDTPPPSFLTPINELT